MDGNHAAGVERSIARTVTDLHGRETKWEYTKYHKRKSRQHKSKLHCEALSLLEELYPAYEIYEEVTIPGERLDIDLFIGSLDLAVEVHGRQHYEYIPHFFKSKKHWMVAKANDRRKIEWCELNDIDIVILPYNEKKQWRSLIQERE